MKKVDKKVELSPQIKNLLTKYQSALEEIDQQGKAFVLHADEIASKVAIFYEKIRKIIDWKEEHLLRRSTIERILKRKLISELSSSSLMPHSNPKKMAEPLVMELVRSGHFPNGKISRHKVNEVEKILEKYIFVLDNFPLAKSNKVKERINFFNWVIEICACEIEENLGQPAKENLILNFMTEIISSRIQVDPNLQMAEKEKVIQTYVAAHRTLYNLDNPIISYHLLKIYYPQWLNPDQELIKEVSEKIIDIRKKLEKDLDHPHSGKFRKICEKYDAVFLIIGDVINLLFNEDNENIETKLSNPQTAKKLVTETYESRLSTLKERLTRAAIYSTLSILIASSLSLFIVEVPIANILYGGFQPLAIAVDLLLPATVMFLLIIGIKLPPEENLDRVIEEVFKVIYSQKEEDVYELRSLKRGFVSNIIIKFLYLFASLTSLSLIFGLFWLARIPLTSLIIDTLIVSMVVFAGLNIRQRAKELTIDEKGGFWQFLLDVLSIPVAKLGQWLSNKWREYNIVSVFLTVLIDVPFSSLVEFIESWSNFLKEKKAELH